MMWLVLAGALIGAAAMLFAVAWQMSREERSEADRNTNGGRLGEGLARRP